MPNIWRWQFTWQPFHYEVGPRTLNQLLSRNFPDINSHMAIHAIDATGNPVQWGHLSRDVCRRTTTIGIRDNSDGRYH